MASNMWKRLHETDKESDSEGFEVVGSPKKTKIAASAALQRSGDSLLERSTTEKYYVLRQSDMMPPTCRVNLNQLFQCVRRGTSSGFVISTVVLSLGLPR